MVAWFEVRGFRGVVSALEVSGSVAFFLFLSDPAEGGCFYISIAVVI